MTAKRILVVDGDESQRHALRCRLADEGYAVSEAATGPDGLAAMRTGRPDLVLLDAMLPELSGLDVCRAIRAESSVPIIMTGAGGDEVDTVLGLQIGADDYLAKPLSLAELVARIQAVLRRSGATGEVAPERGRELEEIDAFRLDRAARTVRVGDSEVHLAPREFDLLAYLLEHAGRALSRDTLLRHVWGSSFVGDRKTVDVHVRWIRDKMDRFPQVPFRIVTVFGVGYRLDKRVPG